MNAAESKLQIAIMRWWALSWRELGAVDECLLFHVPNGGRRDCRSAAIFKKMGVWAGVPDLLLLCPRHGFGGLAIELKSGRGHLTDEQISFAQALLGSGFLWLLIRDIGSAQTSIRDYLGAGRYFSAWQAGMRPALSP